MAAFLIPIALELAKQFLPHLVGKIAGDKAGKVAEVVVNTATGVTGAKTPEEALAMLQANAQLQHEYRMAMLEHEAKMAALAADERKDERRTDNEDRAGSRLRDVEVRKLSGGQNVRADVMVVIAALGLAGTGLAILWLTWTAYGATEASTVIKPIDAAVFSAVLTQLANIAARFAEAMMSAYQFEFGSSRSSRIMAEANALQTAVAQRRE